MIHDPDRVAAIQKRVEGGLARLQEMGAVKDEDFREWLNLTWNHFEDIESFFLKDLSRQERAPADESFWLSGAERFLSITERQCARIYDLFKKYGPDIKFM